MIAVVVGRAEGGLGVGSLRRAFVRVHLQNPTRKDSGELVLQKLVNVIFIMGIFPL